MKKIIYIVIFVFLIKNGFAQQKIETDKVLTNKEWKEIYSSYNINKSSIEILKSKTGKNLRLDVYFAFWCGDSVNNVPKFKKIIDKIDQNNLSVNYYIVKRKKNREIKYYVKKLKIERIPTFIFYRDNKEIGRIIENPKNDLTEDFLEIIF